ncbi:hypothetical protein [Amycolatopsis sp. WQ 127309]|uniref:hypothetical protein n=1 Tax=Amycolatopsis sp. WQ 127309 TaxID=2932773 RepID=UPI001FF48058|nr:hypothetical protein [Amycolatopsis sp. WQ 127309]UOZ07910.1 hypothetical protein MUY22_06390 [Amycolatopsis sp. WQ 127309]
MTVDWINAVAPADLCFSSTPVKLQNGMASIQSSQWGPLTYGLTDAAPTYGDLTGDGKDEIGLKVYRVPEGAGGSGIIAQGFVILDGASGTAKLIGNVIAVHSSTPGLNSPGVNRIDIIPGGITSYEKFYTVDDPSCCPSRDAVTNWTYRDGKLSHGTTVDK